MTINKCCKNNSKTIFLSENRRFAVIFCLTYVFKQAGLAFGEVVGNERSKDWL